MPDNERLNDHRIQNTLQTFLLVAGMLALTTALGYLLWGATGLVWAGIFGLGLVLFGGTASPSWLLRFLGARRLRPDQAPALFAMTRDLARRAGLEKTPGIFIVPQPYLNAFALGSEEEPAIGVTAGLLRRMDARELNAIVAHEIAHIANRDVKVMSLAAVLNRVTGFLSAVGRLILFINLPLMLLGRTMFSWWAILLLLAAPLLSGAMQLSLSRTREYDADLGAVKLTGDPQGLALALRRLEALQGYGAWGLTYRQAPRQPGPFSTHPPTDERIARLMDIAGGAAPPRYVTLR